MYGRDPEPVRVEIAYALVALLLIVVVASWGCNMIEAFSNASLQLSNMLP